MEVGEQESDSRSGSPLKRSRNALPLRLHLPQIITLMVAFVFIVMDWAGDVRFYWWQVIGLEPSVWWHLGTLALMVIPMLLRVRHPAIAMLLGLAIVVLDFTIGFNLGIMLCLTDLIHSFALRMPRRAVKIATITLALFPLAGLSLAFTPIMNAENAVSFSLLLFAVFILPIWWASEVRRGLPLWQELDVHEQLKAERHASMLRAQTLKRRAAIDAERRNMARELHDVVSSQVSAIALTSGAVLNAPPDTERDRKALESVRRTSVEALDQLGEMVRLLRGDTREADSRSESTASERDRALGYAELLESTTWDDVLERVRSHGLEVDVIGHPPAGLSPALHHVLLRVLQESLTNALKYSDGRAEVRVGREGHRLLLQITSPTSSTMPALELGSGTGLVAMRERVELMAGTFSAGPRSASASGAADNWIVEAELPLKESR